MNRNILFNSKLLHEEGLFVVLVLHTVASSDLFKDPIAGFILIKMVLFTGEEGL